MQTEHLTYSQLEHLLTALGYHQTPSPADACVYVYPEYDAVSVLPRANESDLARPHYLTTLHRVAVEKGIVDEQTFAALLREVRRQTVEPFAKAS